MLYGRETRISFDGPILGAFAKLDSEDLLYTDAALSPMQHRRCGELLTVAAMRLVQAPEELQNLLGDADVAWYLTDRLCRFPQITLLMQQLRPNDAATVLALLAAQEQSAASSGALTVNSSGS